MSESNESEVEHKKATDVKSIGIDDRGLVVAKDNSELLRYCGAVITSGMVPDRFDNPLKLFGALMFVRALGLPDISIRQVANIKGTPSLFGDLPLALVQKSKELTKFKEQWFDEHYNVISFENKNLLIAPYGAVCFIQRGQDEMQSFSFTMDDAKQAGLYPAKRRDGTLNTDSPWEKYTSQMLRYKARSLALKSKFADCISGASIAESDFDMFFGDEPKDVTQTDKASELLKELNNE